jgi:hypothetical protein
MCSAEKYSDGPDAAETTALTEQELLSVISTKPGGIENPK